MTDVLIYWRDYKHNWIGQFAGERASFWHSNAKLLGDLQSSDHLWMVASGTAVRSEPKPAGFLVAIWTVDRVVENLGDNPAYPRDEYRFRVVTDTAQAIDFSEPVPVDHILRPQGRDRTVSIGRFLQGPRRLNEDTLRLLRAAAGPERALRWLTGNNA